MFNLDVHTLLLVGCFGYVLIGVLTLMSVWLSRRYRTLTWCAVACFLGGFGYLLGLLREPHYWSTVSIWLSNISLLAAWGSIWLALRVFREQSVTYWHVVVSGLIWAGLCSWPPFMASVYARIVVFSLITLIYGALSMRELWLERRHYGVVPLFLFGILGWHGLFYAMRMIPWPTTGLTWLSRPDFGVTVLENMLVIISLAYGILVLVNTRSMQQTEMALRQRSQLLGYISHDLRSPLAGILDAVHLWQEGDTRLDYPGLIRRQARRQMDLIDDLLTFSRIEQGARDLETIPGYLHGFLHDVAEPAALDAERSGNRLLCDFADNLPALVKADFNALHRVLDNLLGNAIKYTRNGHVRLCVECRTPALPGQAVLHFMVDDDGPGMTAEERERLIQPFTRGQGVRGVRGVGLGLTIVSGLLHGMGSRLEIDDVPTGGSRFHFLLTVSLADESELDPCYDDDGHGTVDGAGCAVLVVDDDPGQRAITCDLLDSYGFDGIPADGGHAALDVLAERPVDLVITDQIMADMDGVTLLGRVREGWPDLPVILYSALPPQTMAGGLQFDATLLKPASASVLLQHVATRASMQPVMLPVRDTRPASNAR